MRPACIYTRIIVKYRISERHTSRKRACAPFAAIRRLKRMKRMLALFLTLVCLAGSAAAEPEKYDAMPAIFAVTVEELSLIHISEPTRH